MLIYKKNKKETLYKINWLLQIYWENVPHKRFTENFPKNSGKLISHDLVSMFDRE